MFFDQTSSRLIRLASTASIRRSRTTRWVSRSWVSSPRRASAGPDRVGRRGPPGRLVHAARRSWFSRYPRRWVRPLSHDEQAAGRSAFRRPEPPPARARRVAVRRTSRCRTPRLRIAPRGGDAGARGADGREPAQRAIRPRRPLARPPRRRGARRRAVPLADQHRTADGQPGPGRGRPRAHLRRLRPEADRARGADRLAHRSARRRALPPEPSQAALHHPAALQLRLPGNSEDLAEATEITLDWVRHNPIRDPDTPAEAWTDKVIGDRAPFLAYVAARRRLRGPAERSASGARCSTRSSEHGRVLAAKRNYTPRQPRAIRRPRARPPDQLPAVRWRSRRGGGRWPATGSRRPCAAGSRRASGSSTPPPTSSSPSGRWTRCSTCSAPTQSSSGLREEMRAAAAWFVRPDGQMTQFGDSNLDPVPDWAAGPGRGDARLLRRRLRVRARAGRRRRPRLPGGHRRLPQHHPQARRRAQLRALRSRRADRQRHGPLPQGSGRDPRLRDLQSRPLADWSSTALARPSPTRASPTARG